MKRSKGFNAPLRFPQWHPQRYTASRFGSSDFRVRYKALRYSSSAFIHRQDVRAYIFKRDSYRCQQCGNTNDLTIDHIVSVYRAAINEFPVERLNCKENLRTLCASCNGRKAP